MTREEVPAQKEWITRWKIFISEAYGAGETFPHQILGIPILGEPPSVCTETYISIGPFENRTQTENAMTYMATKFFRALVMLKKLTQHASTKVYQLVPMQDFSKPWTDEELYAKYGLTDEEIAFIESMVKPMEV